MRIGTRGSALALAQTRLVAERLGGDAEIVVVSTSGDRGERGGDKARWVDAIEQELLAGTIDLAVHSAKDVPSVLADGLELVGSPARADPHDALCGARSLAELPHGARVGTSSLRRAAQLRALREDIEPVKLRGNVDTRLRRLSEHGNDLDAIVLARAGLQRLGRDVGTPLPELVPAAGQGTLALQARSGDEQVQAAVTPLRDRDTERALAAERSLVRALDADCYTALGAHARIDGPRIELRAWIGLEDGSAWITDRLPGENPEELGREVAQRMLAVGAGEMLTAGTAAASDD
jgi:hydroxymethylbilane synthase